MGFTINHQKKLFFYLQLSKCILRLTIKKFPCISNFAISSADLHGILAPEESIKLEKPVPMLFKLQFLKLLIYENISNFSASAWPRKPPKHNSQLKLIYTEVNIYFNF